LDRVYETSRALGLSFNATVKPDRAVKGGFLVYEEVAKFCLECICLLG
jgi:hypothetical protein